MLSKAADMSTHGLLPGDPLNALGLRDFAVRFRCGELSAETVTRTYLERIRLRDPKIGAFATVVGQEAIDAARGIDALLRAGTDLGPLMGLPIAIKEIFSIKGLPYGAGTELDLSEMKPAEGSFVQKLKRAGCIILGTTRTTEFAAATININKPMPWNPADEHIKRVCGGSSHGSAAALRAGLCAFSVGSDTGGSVRLPAALCGVFGYKSTAGVWPTEGVFNLSPTLDSLGIFTRSADDATLVFSALDADAAPEAPRTRALRLGKPKTYFFDQLDSAVRKTVMAALDKLKSEGVEVVDIETPDVDAAMAVFVKLLFGEFVAAMGSNRLKSGRATIDPVPWARIEAGFGTDAESLVTAQRAQRAAIIAAQSLMNGLDALVYPTAPFVACPTAEVQTLQAATAWNLRAGRLTRPGNYFGQCGTSIPLQSDTGLPVGLQIICNPNTDARLLAISRTVESIIGSRDKRNF